MYRDEVWCTRVGPLASIIRHQQTQLTDCSSAEKEWMDESVDPSVHSLMEPGHLEHA
jgi:hypothetical protein